MKNRKIDFLTIEIGSTITKANGFFLESDGTFSHVAQGFSATTVLEGDVEKGYLSAVAELEKTSGLKTDSAEILVNSSAAGGLKMTVHGLTYNMTARAAKEASLGAGAIVKMLTAGQLCDSDLEEIIALKPNLILLAGGVDFGERDIVIRNAQKIASIKLSVPVIYAGNVAVKKQITRIFTEAGIELFCAPNVFPDVDILNVDPLRKLIQEAFSRHIIHAPGMEKLAGITKYPVHPTPGVVLRAAELFAEIEGDILVVDVGGATTDVHSVTEGSNEFKDKLLDPEPRAKRTVEGDLGVYVNAENVAELDEDNCLSGRLSDVKAIPSQPNEKEITRLLCKKAVETAVRRHAGTIGEIFTPTGRRQIIRGKDLTAVKTIVGTGGALTKVEGGMEILKALTEGSEKHLLPKQDAKIILDRNYFFSAYGTLSQIKPDEVKLTFKKMRDTNHENSKTGNLS
ncbi:MAG: glutamate mutase L [Candidatus Riflebacteria bacterium]|nr:glutamate mutase L [Candidatus Riflebacteria bacterium]